MLFLAGSQNRNLSKTEVLCTFELEQVPMHAKKCRAHQNACYLVFVGLAALLLLLGSPKGIGAHYVEHMFFRSCSCRWFGFPEVLPSAVM